MGMDSTSNRQIGEPVESYWLTRKAERERLSEEKDKKALEILVKVSKYYVDNYPGSKYGKSYEYERMDLIEPTFEGLTRDQALGFRRALDYYKSEKQHTTPEEISVGHALWNCNQQIPDLRYINELENMNEKKRELDSYLEDLKRLAEKPQTVETIKVKNVFTCQWCEEEFPNKIEILDHIKECSPEKKRRDEIKEKKKEIEIKLFTCQICGVKLEREKLIAHAKEHGKKGETSENWNAPKVMKPAAKEDDLIFTENTLKCPKCNKQYQLQKYYDEHVKKCKVGD